MVICLVDPIGGEIGGKGEGVPGLLDAEPLEVRGIRIDLRHVVGGQEGHLVAEPHQREHVLGCRVRAGILIGCGYCVVDEIGALLDRALDLELGRLAVVAMRRERLLPAFVELALIDDLVTLHADAAHIRARGDALQMHDLGGRLHDHALAGGAHPEAQIRVLVVRRRIMRIEPVEALEQCPLDHQGSAGHVVAVAQIAILGLRGIVVSSPIAAIAQAPNHAAGFLQRSLLE